MFKNKKIPLRGLFWDLEIFEKKIKLQIFAIWSRMVENMLKRALPKEFVQKIKNGKIPQGDFLEKLN